MVFLEYCILLGFLLHFNFASNNNLWRCGDGSLIELSKVCNGENDCPDSTDEASIYCKRYVCGSGYLKCPNGECVKNETSCKKIKKKEQETNRVANQLNLCKVTKIPTNGFVQYLYSPGVYLKIDELVPNLVKVQFTCIANHRIVGNDTIVCRNGAWNGGTPECHPFCPLIEPNARFSANCFFNNESVNCTEPARAGSVANVTCKYGYENVNKATQRTICGTDGQWQPEPLPCNQICGELAEQTIPRAPWHVSIYKRLSKDHPFEPICGGTIVSARVVISAAHCFWDEQNDDFDDNSLFQIKTGKTFPEYDDGKETTPVQSLLAYDLKIYSNFNGLRGKLIQDVIVIILNTFIEFNLYASPICIDYQSPREDQFVSPGLIGHMATWSSNKTLTEPNTMLKISEISVVTREECKDNSPKELIDFLTNDKFCARRLSSEDVGLCRDNSGSGLVFPIENSGKIKYFFRGVASESPANISCGQKNYLTFSNVAYFAPNIHHNDLKFNPIETFKKAESTKVMRTNLNECIISEIPKNGIVAYLVEDMSLPSFGLKLGYNVRNYYLLQYICDENYSLKGKRTNVCLNGLWTNAAPVCSINQDGRARQWECDDGNVIDLTKVCNGKIDCADYSDETLIQCQNYVCGVGYAQCSYGACVRNETDCRVITENNYFDQTSLGPCRIAKIPANVFVHHADETIPGIVRARFTCAENHRIVGNETISCYNGTWDGDIPRCEPYCPPIVSSATFSVICTFNLESANCMKPAKSGTIAEVICKYGYESISSNQQTICTDGSWQPTPTPCTQKCGEQTIESSNINHLPWHVSIYKQSALRRICGGTILNAKTVISAAFYLYDEEKQLISDEEFGIKAGQSFKMHEDDKIQHVTSSIIPKNGINEKHNIILLILKEYFEFNPYTVPICIDYKLYGDDRFVSPGLRGLVGTSGTDESSKTIELSVISREDCKRNASEDFLNFLTDEKFCAKSLSPAITLGQTDMGSGLAFPITKNGKTKYYLRGVASIAPSNDTTSRFFAFKNVAHDEDFIFGYEISNRPVQKLIYNDSVAADPDSYRCTVTETPEHGTLTDPFYSLESKVGYTVGNRRLFKYGCNDNYTLKGDPVNVCLDGEWTNSIPECIPFSAGLNTDCRALPSPRNGHIQYFTNDGFLLGSNKGEKFYAFGTTAKINCLIGFEVSGGSQQTLTCEVDAKWSPDLQDVTCRPVCGKQELTGSAYIIGGEETNITYAPWHVGIYKIKDMEVKYQCGGTILTERIVVSAMHCFWNRKINAAFDANLFKIAAGKQYSDYNSTKDPYPVQHFEITDLNYYSDYRDSSGNFALDIVLLFLNDTIEFQHHIAPICIHLKTVTFYDIPVQPGLIGTLAGWGFTETGGHISDRLKVVDLPTIDKDHCIAESGTGFADFITADKFCAGHLNLGVSACQGDSGGGLVFPEMLRGSKRYFLRGIVSVGANNVGSCDSGKYTTFTNVIYHDKLIRTALLNPE